MSHAEKTLTDADFELARFWQRLLFLVFTMAVMMLTAPTLVPAADKAESEWNADRAFGYLVDICRIGPRPSGSAGMEQQQKLIADHFAKFNAEVRFQSFDAVHPLTGRPVRMNNIIVSWLPRSRERVLLACHYDTRPYPDRDRTNPQGRFLGANDGASGVALFMEFAHHMKSLNPTYGVDFVFFDGEELIYGDQGTYFVGSEFFSNDYLRHPPEHKYHYGVLVDMIGDRRLNIFKERNSLKHAAKLTDSVWQAARDIGVSEFNPRIKHEIQDDHLALNQIAGIPTCDIIDFDYPQWHTTGDVPDRCSGESLVKVGRVLAAWLEKVPSPQAKEK